MRDTPVGVDSIFYGRNVDMFDITAYQDPDYYQLEETYTAEERAVRDRVRAFMNTAVAPIAAKNWEEARFPFELLPGLAQLGIVGGTLKGYGCPGLSSMAYALALQEIARVDGSLSTFLGVQTSLAMANIYAFGSEEQKQRWLPALARLEKIGAFGLTEPEIGSDAEHVKTVARRDGESYVLNGQKRWIGNGTIADVVIIWAKTEDGFGGFLVEKGTPGFETHIMTGKLAQRAVWQAEIHLEECRVPAENRLPGIKLFRDTHETFKDARWSVACGVLGGALGCYDIALRYTRQRKQFGRPLAAFQLVQAKLVEMLNEISKAQLVTRRVCELRDSGKLTYAMASLAKLNNARTARQCALLARELLGGNGILHDYHVMRYLADAEAAYTYEGTNEINTLIVGFDITGRQAFF
jgi:glutaryl-CoA dehydrogenase